MWDEVIPVREVAANEKFRLNEYKVRAGGAWIMWYALFEYFDISIIRNKKPVPYREWKQVKEMTGPELHQLAGLMGEVDLSTIPDEVKEVAAPQ